MYMRQNVAARPGGSLPATPRQVHSAGRKQCREQRLPLQDARLSGMVHLRRQRQQLPVSSLQG